MPNILESYLVTLGAFVDTNSFRKFNVALTGSEKNIGGFAINAVVSFAKMEVGILTSLSAIGLGLISFADRTANADQQYRLFGMRMLMTKSSARAMQQALDELGATIDEVAYDPELNKRFHELYERNIELGKKLGPQFDKDMKQIRDIRMEYEIFGTQLETLGATVIGKFFEKLGFGSGDLQKQLRHLNDWFMDNIPKWADRIAEDLVPVWKDFVIVTKDAGGMFKQLAGDWAFVSGILLGDNSIKNTEFDIRNVIKATLDWIDALAEVALTIQFMAKTAGHGFSALGAWIGAVKAKWRGDTAEEKRLLDLDIKEEHATWNDIRDFFTGGGTAKENPDLAGFENIINYQLDRDKRMAEAPIRSSLSKDIIDAAKKYGLDPNLLSAMLHQESGYDPTRTNKKSGAQGIGQIMPGTAGDLKEITSSPYDQHQGIFGAAEYLSQMINREGGDVSLGLAAYNAGPGNVEKYGGIPPFKETQEYVSGILGDYSRYANLAHKEGSEVHIGSVHITVPHNIPEHQVSKFINDSMRNIITENTRNTTAQVGSGAHY